MYSCRMLIIYEKLSSILRKCCPSSERPGYLHRNTTSFVSSFIWHSQNWDVDFHSVKCGLCYLLLFESCLFIPCGRCQPISCIWILICMEHWWALHTGWCQLGVRICEALLRAPWRSIQTWERSMSCGYWRFSLPGKPSEVVQVQICTSLSSTLGTYSRGCELKFVAL